MFKNDWNARMNDCILSLDGETVDSEICHVKNFETWSSVQQIIIKKRDKTKYVNKHNSLFFVFVCSSVFLFFSLSFFLSSSFFLSPFFSCVWMKMERDIEFFFFFSLPNHLFPLRVCICMYDVCVYVIGRWARKQITTKMNRSTWCSCCFSTIWYIDEFIYLSVSFFSVHCLGLSLFFLFFLTKQIQRNLHHVFHNYSWGSERTEKGFY